MCEINDITVEFTRFDGFCEASFTDQIEVLCGADASLAEGTSICYTDDLDLTQFFTDATTTGGTWSGMGVQGNTLVPSTDGGTYTVTYTVGFR